MEIFLKVLSYSSAVLLPIALLTGLVFLIVKYGISSLFQSLADKIDYVFDKIIDNLKGLFDFIVTEALRIADFISKRVAETVTIMTAINQLRHPPSDNTDYIVLCLTSIALSYMILKKGDVDLDKIGNLFGKIRNKTNNKNEEK